MPGQLFLSVLITITLLVSACYRTPAPQGNALDKATASKIKRGMTPKQVIAAIGDPVTSNVFDDHRLLYIYSYKAGSETLLVKQLVITFRNNKVTQIKTKNIS